MNHNQSRREFLTRVAILPAVALGSRLAAPVSTFAAGLWNQPVVGGLKVSINAYSFNKMLNDNIKHRGPGATLLQVLEFSAKCKSDAFDPTGYFFPGYPERPSDAYVKEFKQRAADLGIALS